MKQMKKWISLVLATLMVVGAFSGCDKIGGSSAGAHAGHIEMPKQNVLTPVADSDVVFLTEGNSGYQIVVPENADSNEQFAATDLRDFIEKASGAKLEIVTESPELPDGKYIFLGNTNAANDAGIHPTYEEVKYNGFRMKLIDDDLYLLGYGSIGTRNAIYEFLDYLFDYDYYAPDEIYVANVKNAKMPAFDLIVNPSFDWRTSNYGWAIWEIENGHRMRMNHGEEMYVNGWNCHYCYDIIDPTVYDYTSEEYKDWYSPLICGPDGGPYEPAQLCYSRNPEMEKTYIENLLKIIAESDQRVVILGQADHPWWCECDSCQAWEDKYGTDAAVTIPFLNRVQTAVNEWFAENRPGEEPTMCLMFAYYETVIPPTKWNAETKAWEPIDETMVIHPDAGIMFAPIGMECDVAFSDYEPDDNTNPLGQLLGWGALTKNIYAWTYSQDFYDYFLMYNTFETVQKNNQALLDGGAVSILDQTQSNAKGHITGWNMAKSYLLMKLQWNNGLNQEELLRDFFAHYYDDAAEEMYDIFMEQRQWLNYVYKKLGANGTIYEELIQQSYWPYNWLENIMDMFDEAFAALDPLREKDPERYALIHDRILLETIQYRYIKLSLYYAEYEERELINDRLAFRYDCERLEIERIEEHVYLKDLWPEWDMQ